MVRNAMWRSMGIALAALAWAAPWSVSGQLTSEAQDGIRRALATQTEARLRLQNARLLPGEPIVMLHPRLASGLLVGEVATGTVGKINVYESMAFPLAEVRELHVRENRFLEGTIVGAIVGVAVAGVLHARCDNPCDGPYTHPAMYALSGSIFAGLGGAVGTFAFGWKVIYRTQPRGLRAAD